MKKECTLAKMEVLVENERDGKEREEWESLRPWNCDDLERIWENEEEGLVEDWKGSKEETNVCFGRDNEVAAIEICCICSVYVWKFVGFFLGWFC